MEITQIPIGSIDLDVRNPRIAHAVEGLAEPTLGEDYIELALGKSSPTDEEQGTSATYSSLREAIKQHGGLISPIVVKPLANGRYLAVEGNTRVAIYRELNRGDADHWKAIPAIVRVGMQEADEHAIRLQAHLIGPRPWRAYAKGKYLHHLYYDKKLSINELLNYCGGNSRKREIEGYIAAYADMAEFYGDQLRASRGYSQFSAFVELQDIKQDLHRAGYSVTDFAKWLADGNIKPLQTVRYLPRILANPTAKRRFLEHDAREALKVLDQPSTSALIKDAPLDQLASALAAKLRTAPWDVLRPLIEDKDNPKSVAVLDCYEELRSLVRHMGAEGDGRE